MMNAFFLFFSFFVLSQLKLSRCPIWTIVVVRFFFFMFVISKNSISNKPSTSQLLSLLDLMLCVDSASTIVPSFSWIILCQAECMVAHALRMYRQLEKDRESCFYYHIIHFSASDVIQTVNSFLTSWSWPGFSIWG